MEPEPYENPEITAALEEMAGLRESIERRMPTPPPGMELWRGANLASLRRTAARLRAGVIPSPDPSVSAEEMAARVDAVHEYIRQVRPLIAARRRIDAQVLALETLEVIDWLEESLATLHAVKREINESDPNSDWTQTRTALRGLDHDLRDEGGSRIRKSRRKTPSVRT